MAQGLRADHRAAAHAGRVLEVALEIDESDLHIAPADELALCCQATERRADDDNVPRLLSGPHQAHTRSQQAVDELEHVQEHIDDQQEDPHDKDDGLDHDHTQAASFGCGRSAVKRVGLVV